MGLERRRSCAVARLDLVWDRKAHWHPATTRLDDQASLQAEGLPEMSATAKHVRSGLKDAGRRQRLAIAGGFPDQSPFSQNRRREMTNELDRLLTITDLSEMLGVPVDTPVRGGGTAVKGPAGYRTGRHVRYRQGSRRGLA